MIDSRTRGRNSLTLGYSVSGRKTVRRPTKREKLVIYITKNDKIQRIITIKSNEFVNLDRIFEKKINNAKNITIVYYAYKTKIDEKIKKFIKQHNKIINFKIKNLSNDRLITEKIIESFEFSIEKTVEFEILEPPSPRPPPKTIG